MKGTAIGFAPDGKDIICCHCYDEILSGHQMPELLIAVTRPCRIMKKEDRCATCERPYNTKESLAAAKRIAKKWL